MFERSVESPLEQAQAPLSEAMPSALPTAPMLAGAAHTTEAITAETHMTEAQATEAQATEAQATEAQATEAQATETHAWGTETPHTSLNAPRPGEIWGIRLDRWLAALPQWLSANTFVPDWLPEQWRSERGGYLIAALAQALGTLITLLLVGRFPVIPHYAVLDALDILAVCLIALSWGAGPSLVATFVGASLLGLLGLLPQADWAARRGGGPADVGLFLAVGIVVTIAASRTERARRIAAEKYHRAHGLATALREANERMDAFLSLVTHELKTPLSAMGLSAGLARRSAARLAQRWKDEEPTLPADAAQLETVQSIGQRLDDIERQIRLQTRLIDDLLDVARIQSEQLELRMAPCDLAQIVRQAVHDQRLLWPTRVIRLQGLVGSVEAGAVPIFADADRIGQVVTNYLTNALKYSSLDRPVSVSLEREGTCAKVAVRDAGPGLSAEEQARIWQRFYRVEGVKA